jgi:hypothetical protein
VSVFPPFGPRGASNVLVVNIVERARLLLDLGIPSSRPYRAKPARKRENCVNSGQRGIGASSPGRGCARSPTLTEAR